MGATTVVAGENIGVPARHRYRSGEAGQLEYWSVGVLAKGIGHGAWSIEHRVENSLLQQLSFPRSTLGLEPNNKNVAKRIGHRVRGREQGAQSRRHRVVKRFDCVIEGTIETSSGTLYVEYGEIVDDNKKVPQREKGALTKNKKPVTFRREIRNRPAFSCLLS